MAAKWSCSNCHNQFSADPSNIRRHERSCQRANTATRKKCRHCTYSCLRSDNLARHIRNQHPPSPASAPAAAVGGTNANTNTNGSALQVPTPDVSPVTASAAPVSAPLAEPVTAALVGANDNADNADINDQASQVTTESGTSQQLPDDQLSTLDDDAWLTPVSLPSGGFDQDLSMGNQFQGAPLTTHHAPANPSVLPALIEDMSTWYQPYQHQQQQQQQQLYAPDDSWSNDNGQSQESSQASTDPYMGFGGLAAFTYGAAEGSGPMPSGLTWTPSQPSWVPSTGFPANVGYNHSYPDPSNGDGFHEAYPAAPEWQDSWAANQPPKQFVSLREVTFN